MHVKARNNNRYEILKYHFLTVHTHLTPKHGAITTKWSGLLHIVHLGAYTRCQLSFP